MAVQIKVIKMLHEHVCSLLTVEVIGVETEAEACVPVQCVGLVTRRQGRADEVNGNIYFLWEW